MLCQWTFISQVEHKLFLFLHQGILQFVTLINDIHQEVSLFIDYTVTEHL